MPTRKTCLGQLTKVIFLKEQRFGLLLLGLYRRWNCRQTPTKPSKPRPFLLSEVQYRQTSWRRPGTKYVYIFYRVFARLMGDMQQYFIDQMCRIFYSVSISGYHIAEAGNNPISQLAFTLSNGFTYIEYYLSRGMHIDDFAPNLSFFFSNGVDPEYAVIGRVARRIWAKSH